MVNPSTYSEVNDKIFEKITIEEGQSTVVVFGSETSGGMSMIDTIMEGLAVMYPSIYFFKINNDRSAYAGIYGDAGMVSICYFKNGKIVDTQIGLSPKSKLKEKIALLE